MLNLEHPQYAHIRAASNQLGFILDFARKLTLATGKNRTDLYLIAEPAFAALRWLNENRFANSPKIANRITYLQMMLKQLVELRHDESLVLLTDRKDCPACGSEVTTAGTYRPNGVDITVPAVRYCDRCLDSIMPAYQELRSAKNGFGIEAI